MKVAIPTNDMTTISTHFGRTKGFMLFNIENNKVTSKEYKLNTFTGHSQNKHKEHDHGEHKHSHETILNALNGCEVVIAGGMGKRLFDDFEQKGIKVYVTQEKSIETAIDLLTKNELDNNTTKCCNH